LYGITSPEVVGLSFWELVSSPYIASRVVNFSLYKTGVHLAKALLELGRWLGPNESQRVADYVAPYRAFMNSRFEGAWDAFSSDIFALSATYKKVVRY